MLADGVDDKYGRMEFIRALVLSESVPQHSLQYHHVNILYRYGKMLVLMRSHSFQMLWDLSLTIPKYMIRSEPVR